MTEGILGIQSSGYTEQERAAHQAQGAPVPVAMKAAMWLALRDTRGHYTYGLTAQLS